MKKFHHKNGIILRHAPAFISFPNSSLSDRLFTSPFSSSKLATTRAASLSTASVIHRATHPSPNAAEITPNAQEPLPIIRAKNITIIVKMGSDVANFTAHTRHATTFSCRWASKVIPARSPASATSPTSRDFTTPGERMRISGFKGKNGRRFSRISTFFPAPAFNTAFAKPPAVIDIFSPL